MWKGSRPTGSYILAGVVVRGLESDARRKTLSLVVSVFGECGDTAAEREKAYWSSEKGKSARGGGFALISAWRKGKGKIGVQVKKTQGLFRLPMTDWRSLAKLS